MCFRTLRRLMWIWIELPLSYVMQNASCARLPTVKNWQPNRNIVKTLSYLQESIPEFLISIENAQIFISTKKKEPELNV